MKAPSPLTHDADSALWMMIEWVLCCCAIGFTPTTTTTGEARVKPKVFKVA